VGIKDVVRAVMLYIWCRLREFEPLKRTTDGVAYLPQPIELGGAGEDSSLSEGWCAAWSQEPFWRNWLRLIGCALDVNGRWPSWQ